MVGGTPTQHCTLWSGAGFQWGCTSDRRQKENFDDADERDSLARLSEVPIFEWSSKGADPDVRHLGPMAQDFSSAFRLGENDTTISGTDLHGVSLAAIQGLYDINQEQQSALETLLAELEALRQQNAELAERLAALEEGAE